MNKTKQNKSNIEVINKNSRGIPMIKKYTEYGAEVSVLDLEGEVITTYEFRNVEPKYENKYLNWQNLDCCGGWAYSKETLINQLKEGLKPFGNVVVNSYKNINAHLLPLIEECSKVEGLRVIEIEHWSDTSREFAILRDGSLDNYIDLDEVLKYYYSLGLPKLSSDDYSYLKDYLSVDMCTFATKDNKFNYDFANPDNYLDFIFTGLLLGYPIESTADRLGL